MAHGARRASRLGLGVALGVALAAPAAAQPAGKADDRSAIADYYQALESQGLIDVASGTRDALKHDLGVAESLLRAGATIDAAVALYAIVESPRFKDLEDYVEYANAEYYLGVALYKSGAYDSALGYFMRAIARGPNSLYFAPAHRRAVDIALETNDYSGVLGRLEMIKLDQPLPVEATGERAYLRGRADYTAGELDAAEGELTRISRKSRLYSSALYLRGVIRTRKGELKDAAAALCEIVDTPDDDKFTFVIDDRYFTIKDLARLGLGRIAHEAGDYDDAYYHYFQIPDDSDRLPEALFEAAWSMYQKRELGTARDLAGEFLKDFPTSPLMPEASLLAGYVELADCKFDDAQHYYDRLVVQLQPIADEIDRIRKDSDLRAALYDKALVRWRAERQSPDQRLSFATKSRTDQVLALLRLDPEFVRLHDAMAGLRRSAGDARLTARAWRSLLAQVGKTQVATAKADSAEADDAHEAELLLEDIRALGDQIGRAQAELRAGQRSRAVPADVAAEESKRLADLARASADLAARASDAADAADAALAESSPASIKDLVRADLGRANELDRRTAELYGRLHLTADGIAKRSLDQLYGQVRHVLDKAKLGKIDAIIGQKRRLEIEVQDLASGRFPAELHGKLWEQGLIGDDEEYWPFEGEFWSDEYEGWR